MTEKALPERIFLVGDPDAPHVNALLWSDEKVNEYDFEYVRCTLQRLKDLERVYEIVRDKDFTVYTDDSGCIHMSEKDLKEMSGIVAKLNRGGDGNG